jgi:hypothetical protein
MSSVGRPASMVRKIAAVVALAVNNARATRQPVGLSGGNSHLPNAHLLIVSWHIFRSLAIGTIQCSP